MGFIVYVFGCVGGCWAAAGLGYFGFCVVGGGGFGVAVGLSVAVITLLLTVQGSLELGMAIDRNRY